MAEEKKATVNVICTLTAKVSYKDQCDNDIVKITFNMSDVPVDATDNQIKLAAIDALSKDLADGKGIIHAVDSEGDRLCFIAVDSFRKFTVLDVEIKKGE